jgi:hypothetical protein
VIYPNDTSITVGVKGQSSQASTPSPSNPVDVVGCGERTGNLWNNGDTWENDDTDTRAFFQPDIALYDGYTKVGDNVRIDVKSNGYKYLVSITPNTSFTRVSVKHNGSTRDLPLGSVYGEFEANVPVTISFIVNGFDPTTIGGISISNIMLNAGATPQPYEPYGQYKIPILLNSQTINKYLGEVQTVRQIKKLVLTGQEEGWVKQESLTATDAYQNYNLTSDYLRTEYIVTHMPVNSSSADTSTHGYIGQMITLCMNKALSLSTVDLFKTWLADEYSAGHPVILYYVLATPQTAVVNEPLMKIGTYADSLTTSVSCTAGENTLDVQTTVQPSEVTATFEGWHTGTVHERENGQWD